jgi:hypothetical protein
MYLIAKFRTLRLSWWTYLLAVLFLGILAYGIHIPFMGFYWDDWPWIWFSNVMGSAGMLRIDIEHRPITGVVLWLGSVLAGNNPVGWQVYNLILRLAGALSLGWFLKKLWPRQGEQIVWIVLLFLIYPGFNQQFIAVNNSRHLFPLTLFFWSMGLMVAANRTPERYWRQSGGAVIVGLVGMFGTEYFYGLELVRPVILGLVVWQSLARPANRASLQPSLQRRAAHLTDFLYRVFKVWLPYLLPLTLIFIWRYTISKWVNYEIVLLDDLSSPQSMGIRDYLLNGWRDLYDAAVTAWLQIFKFPDPLLYGFQARVYFWGLVAIGGAGILVYLIFLKSNPRDIRWGGQALLFGGGALLVSPLPFWVTGLDPRLQFPGDRLNLPLIFGACLLLVGLLDLLIKFRPLKIFFVAVLVGLSVGYHYQNGVTYRRDWQHQTAIFQQLSWRVPGLKSGTTIMSNELPSEYSTDNSLIAPINWIYASEFTGGNLPFFVYYYDLRFNQMQRTFEPGMAFSEEYRFYPFESTSEQILVLYQRLPGCLRVLDNDQHQFDPSLPDEIRAILTYSNPDQILFNQADVLPTIFQGEPVLGGWCYFFEKADLARQRGDWDQVAGFANQAFEGGFHDALIKHAPEYVVFIEGYAHNAQWKRAAELTLEVYEVDPRMDQMLCAAWGRIKIDIPESSEKSAFLEKIDQKMNCGLD